MKKVVWFITVCLFWCFSGCASQQDIIGLDNRIAAVEQEYSALEQQYGNLRQSHDALEKQNRELRSIMDRYTSVSSEKDLEMRDQSAVIHALIERLRDENRLVSGQLEESQYRMNQKMAALEDSRSQEERVIEELKSDLELNKKRIVRVEQYLNFETSETKPPGRDVAAEIPAERVFSEKEIYALAKQAFDQGDFEASRQGFLRLLKVNPKSENADNAQFWIGETYYREKWYEKAILEYQKVIENYSKGNKVQAAFLKQGLAFYNLGDKANARLILNELIKKHPASNEAKIARQKLKAFK